MLWNVQSYYEKVTFITIIGTLDQSLLDGQPFQDRLYNLVTNICFKITFLFHELLKRVTKSWLVLTFLSYLFLATRHCFGTYAKHPCTPAVILYMRSIDLHGGANAWSAIFDLALAFFPAFSAILTLYFHFKCFVSLKAFFLTHS